MNNIVYIVDGIGTSTAQNFIIELRKNRNSVKVIGLDGSPRQAGKFLVDKFFISPLSNSDDFVPFVKDLMDRFTDSHVVYIPIIDYGFDALSKIECSSKDLIIISNTQTIEFCDNKLLLASILEKATNTGFSIPLGEERTCDIKDFPYPMIVKPKKGGRASLDVFTCNNEKEAREKISCLKDNSFFQQKIFGREVTVDVICDLNGKFISYVCRERLEVKAGVCQKAFVFQDERYKLCVESISRLFSFRGPFNAQFIESKDGTIYLIEINPRFSGGLNLSIAAGWNSVAALDFLVSGYFSDKGEGIISDWIKKCNLNSIKPGYSYKISKALYESV